MELALGVHKTYRSSTGNFCILYNIDLLRHEECADQVMHQCLPMVEQSVKQGLPIGFSSPRTHDQITNFAHIIMIGFK